jgi:fructose/tagatose bisphosphate aldolase
MQSDVQVKSATRVAGGVLSCDHCKTFEPIPQPIKVGLLNSMIDKFNESHKSCVAK